VLFFFGQAEVKVLKNFTRVTFARVRCFSRAGQIYRLPTLEKSHFFKKKTSKVRVDFFVFSLLLQLVVSSDHLVPPDISQPKK
jgi:hypothetical protein